MSTDYQSTANQLGELAAQKATLVEEYIEHTNAANEIYERLRTIDSKMQEKFELLSLPKLVFSEGPARTYAVRRRPRDETPSFRNGPSYFGFGEPQKEVEGFYFGFGEPQYVSENELNSRDELNNQRPTKKAAFGGN